MPEVALFIPCYVDQLYPRVGMATVEVLERYGCQVEFPEAQTCCGQPMANSGCIDQARPVAELFVRTFAGYEAVVCPSGSCAAMVRHHYQEYFPEDPTYQSLRGRVYELVEFLTQVLGVERIEGRFPYKVGLHQSCHGLRELRLGQASELVGPAFSQARQLLESLEEIELVQLQRPDECCGFGGTFAVSEEAVSCMMGRDRIHDHQQGGSQVITSLDMSCLMHLQGLLRRDKTPISVMHISEILAGDQPVGLPTPEQSPQTTPR